MSVSARVIRNYFEEQLSESPVAERMRDGLAASVCTRLDPRLPIEHATLESIFGPHREAEILRAISPQTSADLISINQEIDVLTR